jgi:rhamnogalacturonyl hydrolase YesR
MINRRALMVAMTAAAISGSARAANVSAFASWPKGQSPQEIGKRVAEHFVIQPHGNMGKPSNRGIIYPEACAWYGALTFAALSGDKDLSARLAARFEPLFTTEANLLPTANHVDPSMFGAVPFELYIETRDPRYLAIGKTIADRQWAPPPEGWPPATMQPADRAIAEEAVAKGLSSQTRFWIDDMWMITILEVQAFRATGDTVYLDRAAKEMSAYLDRLQQPNGLFFHAPDVPFFWGRGNGWFAAGMAEMLRSLPDGHPEHARILAGYNKMMKTLLATQSDTGLWRQLIDKPESWPETSGSAMFTFAMITGAKNGWLGKDYAAAARKGWLGLCANIDDNAEIHEVCEGTNKKNDYQYYIDRKRNVGDLHGQAPVMWCASALLRA